MSRYRITGGKKLKGNLFVQGSKNAVLPMIAAALLPEKGQTVLRNVPPFNDVKISIKIAESIGAKVEYYEDRKILVIDSSSVNKSKLESSLTKKSRASILFLPVLLHRMKKVLFDGSGGCAFGARPLDFHYNGFKRMGAEVKEIEEDKLEIKAKKLKGNLVYSDIPSWTGTENLMMAGCLAEGKTIIENAASEPEILDFANLLTKMGAKISGVGSREIIIEGVDKLKAADHTVMADRLDAATFMMAIGIAGGSATFVGADLEYMRILKIKLEQMGIKIEADGKIVKVSADKNKIRPINIVTWPYPGFSTDYMPAIMALSTIASGTSYIRENVFDTRFTQAEGLSKFGAKIKVTGRLAEIEGVLRLNGAKVSAPDLRAGMSYVLAGLAAKGETVIDNVYQIERGYFNVVERIQGLGGEIEVVY